MFYSLRALLFGLVLFLYGSADAQDQPSTDLIVKSLRDTVLGRRTLVVPDPFNATGALRRLFPGKWYDLSSGRDKNQLISWACPPCKPHAYSDANGDMDNTGPFPYEGGVATRLINVFSYSDSDGKEYKVISFNHSRYDPDGFQTVRFTGGLLGMAKFVRIDNGWQLELFQPAIGAYGSFSQCPTPEPLVIGAHQYAYMIHHVNGGPGGPFRRDSYLIAEDEGTYRQVMTAIGTGSSDGGDSVCKWKSTCRVIPGRRSSFRDVEIVCRGHFWAIDTVGLPVWLKGRLKGYAQGDFTITRVFTYHGHDGYLEPARAVISIRR